MLEPEAVYTLSTQVRTDHHSAWYRIGYGSKRQSLVGQPDWNQESLLCASELSDSGVLGWAAQCCDYLAAAETGGFDRIIRRKQMSGFAKLDERSHTQRLS